MGKLTRALAGLVSIAALAKLLSRRRRHQPAPAEPDPAAELRRKLDETRSATPADPSPAPAEEQTALAGDTEPSVDERREAVHARAQDAIDTMRQQDG